MNHKELREKLEKIEITSHWVRKHDHYAVYLLKEALSALREPKCETCGDTEEVRMIGQPCGCVFCTCEDPVQCHGCGARICDAHRDKGLLNPIMKPCPACQPKAEPSELPIKLITLRMVAEKREKNEDYMAGVDPKEILALFARLDTAEAQLAEAKEVNRWIPVEEKTPEVGEIVFMTGGKEVFVGLWSIRPNVTHWRPIVLPEQAEKGE